MDDLVKASGITAGASILGNLLGSNQKMPRKYLRTNKELLRYGNEQDLLNQQAMFDYRIDQGLKHGMTEYEMFTGGAVGAGGGTSGSGAMLGNNYSQAAQQEMQMNQQMKMQTIGNVAELAKTAMQVEGQKEVAGIQAGATIGSAQLSASTQQNIANLQNAMAEKKLKLDQELFDQVTLPAAAEQLKLTEQQTLKAINEVTTSNEKFVLMMKRLSMSADNVLMEFAQNYLGIDATNRDQVSKLSEAKKQKFTSLVASLKSNIFAETAGLQSSNVMQNAGNFIGNTVGAIGNTASDIVARYSQYVDGMTNPAGTNKQGKNRDGRRRGSMYD
jgi:hypothetical protein